MIRLGLGVSSMVFFIGALLLLKNGSLSKSYYYCHSEALRNVTLLVEASSNAEAHGKLLEYLKWAKVPDAHSICSSVYAPE